MRVPIKDKKSFIQTTLFWLNVLLLALLIRLPFLSHLSTDYTSYLESWLRSFISEGYSVFKYDLFGYNVPYPYLISAAVTLLPDFPIIAVKSISIIFDFILAFLVYKCVRLKYPDQTTVPILAFLVVIFSPTVVLNSAAWAQSDTVYTAFLVACLYALLRGRQVWAFIAFGLSFSFKPQAIFLAPFLLWLLFKGKVKSRYFLLIPLIFFITMLPAWFIGRPLDELLFVYIDHANEYTALTLFAPNLYQWIDYRHEELYPAGIILSAYVMLVITLLVYKSQAKMTSTMLVQLAAFSTLIMPFILPRMHGRFFIPAGIIAIILAFYVPKTWYIPVIIGLTNLIIHTRYLYQYKPISLNQLSILLLIAIVGLGVKLLRTLEYLPATRSICLDGMHWTSDHAGDDIAPSSPRPSV